MKSFDFHAQGFRLSHDQSPSMACQQDIAGYHIYHQIGGWNYAEDAGLLRQAPGVLRNLRASGAPGPGLLRPASPNGSLGSDLKIWVQGFRVLG